MRIVGKITEWQDERGFGFATRAKGEGRVFFHIKDFERRSRRPQVGDRIYFEITRNKDGREKAASIILLAGPPLPEGFHLAALVSLSFIMLLIGGAASGRLPWWLLGVYFGMGLISALLYRRDKAAAKRRLLRTREARLLLVDLLGGWIGGMFAQVMFRHKRRKPSFMFPFWLIVGNHFMIGVLVATGWPEQAPLLDGLRSFFAVR